MASAVEGPLLAPSSRARWVAGVLRERLLSGAFRPGEWIREVALREEFGVSNGPVREALIELIADGLLERVEYRGVRVIELGDRDVVELFQLRSALLELAAELAAKRRDPAALERVDEITAYVERSSQGVVPLTGAFTTWLAEASGSERLRRAWAELFAQTQLYVSVTRTTPPGLGRQVESIKRVIRAIVAGDPQTARANARAFTKTQVEALGLESLLGSDTLEAAR